MGGLVINQQSFALPAIILYNDTTIDLIAHSNSIIQHFSVRLKVKDKFIQVVIKDGKVWLGMLRPFYLIYENTHVLLYLGKVFQNSK